LNDLHARLGKLPYLYVVQPELNDYQVTLECPIGRAVITEIDGGEDYEIETVFDGQSVRLYSGYESPAHALDWLVNQVEHTLFNRGVTPPPRVNPRIKAYTILIAVCAAILVAVFLIALFSGTSDNDGGPRPSTSITITPEAPNGH
jgi:hypothetical protein